MLQTNLSTRPFYNERAARAAIVLFALVVVAFTAFNVARIVALTREQGQLAAEGRAIETRAAEQRRVAERIRRGIDADELARVAESAREANAIIDERTFSWTGLFSRFEETLPADARIASVRPDVDEQGRLRLTIVVLGRHAEDVDQFVQKLEATGAFSEVMSRQEFVNPDGLLETTLGGIYQGTGRSAPAGVAPAAGGRN
jgi:Tfp pilus assembly protein PilN